MAKNPASGGNRYDPENDPSNNDELRQIEAPVGDDIDSGRSRDYDHDEGGERQPRKSDEPNPIHAGRNAIYAKRKEEREEEFEGEDEARTLVWPKGMEPTHEGDDGDEPAPIKRKLKVYGEERELTQDEIDALAQKQLASDTKFEDYKALEQRARAAEIELEVMRRAGPQARQPIEDEPDADELEAQTRAEEMKAKKLEALRQIQMGDEDEALAAFESLLSETRVSPEELARIADERAEQAYDRRRIAEQTESQRRNAIDDFAREYPEIAKSEELALIVATRSHKSMVEEMRKIGVEPEDLDIARNDATVARSWYDALRQKGYEMPDAMTVIKGAGETVYRDFNIPRSRRQEPREAPPRGNDRAGRLAEKRSLISEPSRAASQERNQPAIPRSREDVVANMRAKRGQPT